jgi:hypothetical protein
VSADSTDDRSAEEVTAAKEAVLEAEHAPFVQAILDGSLPTSVVVAAMGDAAEEVRDAALSVARAAVSGDAASGKSSDLLAALASAVDGEAGVASATRGKDLARGAVVALYRPPRRHLPARRRARRARGGAPPRPERARLARGRRVLRGVARRRAPRGRGSGGADSFHGERVQRPKPSPRKATRTRAEPRRRPSRGS